MLAVTKLKWAIENFQNHMDYISNHNTFYVEKRPSRVLRLSVPKLVGVRGRISPIFFLNVEIGI